MRPSDLYAMPTIDEDFWSMSPAIAVMFGEEVAYLRDAGAPELPLAILTKAHVRGPDPDGESDTSWQVLTWDGAPFGIVVRSGDVGWRVVTDASLHALAWQALVALAASRVRAQQVRADAMVQGLDEAGGHVLAVTAEGFRPVDRRTCGGRVPVVDLDRLTGSLPHAEATLLDALGLSGRDGLRDVVLAAVPPGLRATAHYDAVAMHAKRGSFVSGWDGPLVATDDGTYLLCVGANDAGLPLSKALRVVVVGAQTIIDDLATGIVMTTRARPPGP